MTDPCQFCGYRTQMQDRVCAKCWGEGKRDGGSTLDRVDETCAVMTDGERLPLPYGFELIGDTTDRFDGRRLFKIGRVGFSRFGFILRYGQSRQSVAATFQHGLRPGGNGMTDPLLAAAQSHLQVLADQLDERGDPRAATVRRFGQDLLAFVTEFERLQELEMVAGDLYQLIVHRKAGSSIDREDVMTALKPFFEGQGRRIGVR